MRIFLYLQIDVLIIKWNLNYPCQEIDLFRMNVMAFKELVWMWCLLWEEDIINTNWFDIIHSHLFETSTTKMVFFSQSHSWTVDTAGRLVDYFRRIFGLVFPSFVLPSCGITTQIVWFCQHFFEFAPENHFYFHIFCRLSYPSYLKSNLFKMNIVSTDLFWMMNSGTPLLKPRKEFY